MGVELRVLGAGFIAWSLLQTNERSTRERRAYKCKVEIERHWDGVNGIIHGLFAGAFMLSSAGYFKGVLGV